MAGREKQPVSKVVKTEGRRMQYTSYTFLFFTYITVVIYYTVHTMRQWIILLLSSIVFYLCSGPVFGNDDLMSMVFAGNKEATELLLKTILKKQYHSCKRCWTEGIPEAYCGRPRLDILVKGSTGKYYNVEVQKNGGQELI